MNSLRLLLKTTLMVLFITFSAKINAQTSVKGSVDQNNSSVAKEGTFQFMIHDLKTQEYFTTDVLKKIEEARDQKEVKIIRVSEKTRVRILPYDVINSPNFKPLQDLYIFDNTND